MSTIFDFQPLAAQFNPSVAYPALLPSNNRMVLAFDTTTKETCYFEGVVPQGITGTITAVISYRMATGNSGGVAFGISIESVSSGDAFDMDAGDSFDTINTGTDSSVPATAGYMEQISFTLSNVDPTGPSRPPAPGFMPQVEFSMPLPEPPPA